MVIATIYIYFLIQNTGSVSIVILFKELQPAIKYNLHFYTYTLTYIFIWIGDNGK